MMLLASKSFFGDIKKEIYVEAIKESLQIFLKTTSSQTPPRKRTRRFVFTDLYRKITNELQGRG